MTKYFTHKEISWLSFNERVLQEALDTSAPLANRITFLGIYSSNLDEFFRVRVATLKRLAGLGESAKKYIGEDPARVLKKVQEIVSRQQKMTDSIYDTIVVELAERNIVIVNERDLSPEHETFVRAYFKEYVRPRIFPIMLNAKTPFPELADKSIYLAIALTKTGEEKSLYSVIEIPTASLPRFVILPEQNGKQFLMFLDDAIRFNLNDIFAIFDFDRIEAYTIKLTRDAELDIENDFGDNYVSKINKSLKRRKQGNPVRFVYDRAIDKGLFELLTRKLKLSGNATLSAGGRYHNFRDLKNFPDIIREKNAAPSSPLPHPALIEQASDLQTIRKRDVLLHTPYQSFDNFIDLLREASIDPHVKSIKITLYRLANHSSVANALINAIKNGKDVTALVELQARFDEASNIYWANQLKDEGARVIYGVLGLKVHAKLCVISRTEGSGMTHYVCVGTGNFNETTAKTYADTFFFTADKRIAFDATQLFDFFETNYKVGKFDRLIIAPFSLRKKILKLIGAEIKNAEAGLPAAIDMKLNNVSDVEIAEKLYEASAKGVKIRMIVRAMFSIIPGIKGVSENIEARSIVDKYLEHSRFMIFKNAGKEKYYITSADLMPRNLDKRVEIACPIYDAKLQEELKAMFEIQWADTTKARTLDRYLKNEYHKDAKKPSVRAQDAFYDYLKNLAP